MINPKAKTRPSKFDKAALRKKGIATIIEEVVNNSPHHYTIKTIDPPHLYDYITPRAGKDNPVDRETGEFGLTFGLYLYPSNKPDKWIHFPRVEYTMVTDQMITRRPSNIQLKIPCPPDVPMPTMDLAMEFTTARIMGIAWGLDVWKENEDGEKALVGVELRQLALCDLSALLPGEIKLVRPEKDPHQIRVDLTRIIMEGRHPGWHDVKNLKRLLNRSVTLDVYIIERLKWLNENMKRRR